MSVLAHIIHAAENYDRFTAEQVDRARNEAAFREQLLRKWEAVRAGIGSVQLPTGLSVPRMALPQTDDAREVARYLFGEGLPGEFPFVNGAYKEMYLEPAAAGEDGRRLKAGLRADVRMEEPTRLFAGLGLAEDTNARFHYLRQQQRSIRLSTAFDGPTLYGMDSDAEAVFGKIGEGGVAIDTVEDMERLYAGFPLGDEHLSVSMTINGPAPIILAMYVAAARRRFGAGVIPNLRGTVQADILKEVQAQNEMIFPIEASLRFLTDMVEYTTHHMPRWYPISISGYHMGEAGATPVQQAAYTLSNGFAYVEMFRDRGLNVNQFGPRLSFFLDCGLDLEYLALARVCRKIWAIGMRDVFGADERAQLFKLHIQTSGRSLIADEFKNNLTRTATELMLAYMNAANSTHSNSADEPFTTPSEEYVRLAAHAQGILLEETGLFKYMMNALAGSPGMKIVEQVVQEAILAEFRVIDRLGGVLAAIEHRYQRSQIQSAAHRYEQQIYEGTRPIIGLNRYHNAAARQAEMKVVTTPRKKRELQIRRLAAFKRRNARLAAKALDDLAHVVESGGNIFAELLRTVESCSLGQITKRLHELVGRYRPTV
jgi:methylmalonyl-CoA mutase cobalamin-binding domain/chain